jgi:hypothetical protein
LDIAVKHQQYEKDDLSEVSKSHFPELVAAGDSDGTQPKKKKKGNPKGERSRFHLVSFRASHPARLYKIGEESSSGSHAAIDGDDLLCGARPHSKGLVTLRSPPPCR